MAQATATQQITHLREQLNQALLERVLLEERLKALDENIKAFRNILAGVGIGQQVEAERAAAAAAKKAEESTPNE